MQPRLRGDDGQTTAEYLGMLAVVALLVGAIALANPNVGGALADALRATICLITGDDCSAELANPWEPTSPCVRASSGGRGGAQVHVGVIDLGGGTGFLIEEYADGTVHVTTYEEGSIGASTGAGGGLNVSTGGSSPGARAEARAGADVTQRNGQTVVFDDRDAAGQYVQDTMVSAGIDALPPGISHGVSFGRGLIDRVTGHETPRGREESTQSTTSVSIDGEARAGVGPGSAITEGSLGGAYERKTNAVTGHTTYSFDLTGSLGSGADVALTANLAIGGDGQVGARLTVDEHGRPISFEATGEFGGRVDLDLADVDEGVTGLIDELQLSADHTASTTVKASLTLDLTKDPAHTAAVESFLTSVTNRDIGGAGRSGQDVWDAMVSDSTVSLTTYDSSDGRYGLDARGRLGLGLGLGVGVDTTSEQLTGAWFYDRGTGRLEPWTNCTT